MRLLGLKMQITLLVTLLVAGLVSSFSWIIATNEKRMILSEVMQRVVLQGRNIALSSSKPLLHKDPEFELHPLITRVLQTKDDIVSVVVIDSEGVIRGHRDLTMIDKTYSPTPDLGEKIGIGFLSAGEVLRENDAIIEVSVPVTDRDERIGFVHLQYSKNEVHEAVERMKSHIIQIGLIALIAGAVISLLLAMHITRPVKILTEGVEAIGRGNLETRIDIRSGREIQALANTFNDMAKSLAESQKAMLDKERMDKELEIAHDIQTTLLPAHLPHLLNFEIDAYYHPASQVGGDYFDLIPTDKRHLMIVVGDVAGKGVPGLVIMAMVRILVRDLALRRENPAKLLRHLNSQMIKDMKKNLFVTLFCGLLDSEEGTLDFASAAHMPLLFYHGREKVVHMVGTKTKPLGIFPDDVFSRNLEEKRVTLAPGDLLMQFTDGLNEMRNESGQEFGIQRIMQIAIDEAAGGARHLLERMRSALDDFRKEAPQSDDLTLLAVNALPSGLRRAAETRMESLDKVAFD